MKVRDEVVQGIYEVTSEFVHGCQFPSLPRYLGSSSTELPPPREEMFPHT